MNEEQQALYEKFIEDYANARVIAVNGLIEALINQVLDMEKKNEN